MKIGLLSAPSNLGLRPPAPTSVPGCAKAPEALREAGLHRRLAELGAEERGVVLAGRYADDATPGSLRNQVAIVEHARRVAERIDLLRTDGLAPLVLGGDCSILVAAGLSLRRAPGRFGPVPLARRPRLPEPGHPPPWPPPARGGIGPPPGVGTGRRSPTSTGFPPPSLPGTPPTGAAEMTTRRCWKPRPCWARSSPPRRSGTRAWSKPQARSSTSPTGPASTATGSIWTRTSLIRA